MLVTENEQRLRTQWQTFMYAIITHFYNKGFLIYVFHPTGCILETNSNHFGKVKVRSEVENATAKNRILLSPPGNTMWQMSLF